MAGFHLSAKPNWQASQSGAQIPHQNIPGGIKEELPFPEQCCTSITPFGL